MHPDEESPPAPGDEPQPQNPPSKQFPDPAAPVEASASEPETPPLGSVEAMAQAPAPPEDPPSYDDHHDHYDAPRDGEVSEPETPSNLFGVRAPDPYIPLPGEERGDPRHARDARANLDLDLARIKRRKRFGLLLTTLSVFFVALFVAPVTWALVYLFVDAPSTVLMVERAAEGRLVQHAPVPVTRMSPYIVRSVIAAEDANFCTHHGFDVAAIQDAMESNADGGRMRGGSTISQQTAKNLFLWPQRSWVRKGFETYFTALIEFMWPKRRIMEQYLNAAEWGDGIFGVEAASRARFGVSAADLTPLQAARLAAVLPSPNRWSATSPGPYVRGRSASIVARAQVIANQHMAGCVLSLDAAP